MAQTYRYSGDAVAVVLIDSVAFRVEPNRVYDADDLIVVSRPDLFVPFEGSDNSSAHLDRIEELEDELAALQAAVLDGSVEDASAAPGAKRARTAQRG